MEDVLCHLRVIVQKVTTLLPPSYDYNETHYQAVLVRELQNSKTFSSYTVSSEVVIPYQLEDGFTFGYGRADLILEDRNANRCIIIELKAGVGARSQQLMKYKAQTSKYIKHHCTKCQKRGVVIIFNPTYFKYSFKIVTMT